MTFDRKRSPARISRSEAIRFRIQIKPSWSARVYGTYHIGARHFVIAGLLVIQAVALMSYLALLNASRTDLSATIDHQRHLNTISNYHENIQALIESDEWR